MDATSEKSSAASGASPRSDSTLEGWTLASGRGTLAERFARRRVAVEKSLRSRWSPGAACQASFRANSQAVGKTVRQAGATVETRTAPTRLDDRTVDATTHRRVDRKRVRRPLRPIGRMASLEADWLELSEARAEGARAGPTGRREMAPARLAALKKTPVAAGDRWSCSMNRGSCCSRPYDVLGRRKAKRPSWTVGIGTIDCRSSRHLRFLRSEGDWVFTSISSTTISWRMISKSSSRGSSNGLAARSHSSWIVGRCIGRALGGWKDVSASESVWSGCPLTHRNSTPTNKSGTTPNTPTWPTSFPTTSCTWESRLPNRCATRKVASRCCTRFLNTPDSNSEVFTLLFKAQ